MPSPTNPLGPAGFDANVSPKQVRKAVARSAHKPMHPGLRNLLSFDTPPDGDKLSPDDVAVANPSLEVLDAAAQLTPDELEHLFIDSVGSFEVTHPSYRPPKKRPEVLINFFYTISVIR